MLWNGIIIVRIECILSIKSILKLTKIELGQSFHYKFLKFNYIDLLNLESLGINYFCHKIVRFDHKFNDSKDIFLDVCLENVKMKRIINPEPLDGNDPTEFEICGKTVLYDVVKGTNYTQKFDCFNAVNCHLHSCGSNECSGNGICVNGKCSCHNGYLGYQCNIVSPRKNFYAIGDDTIFYEGEVYNCDILNITVDFNSNIKVYSFNTNKLYQRNIELYEFNKSTMPSLRENCYAYFRLGEIREMFEEEDEYYIYSCTKLLYECNGIPAGEVILKCEELLRNKRCAVKKPIIGRWLGIAWYYWLIIFTLSFTLIGTIIFLNVKVRLRRSKLKKIEEEEYQHLLDTQH